MFDMMTGLIAGGGELGVFLLMVIENIFPPIPSELVMPLAGFLAATGEMSAYAVIAAGTTGSVLGASLWYALARALGAVRFLALVDRFGHWLTIDRTQALAAIHWFERHGALAVFLGRMVPGVRTLISVPAGLAGMRFLPFLAMTLAGSLIWVSGLTLAGYVLRDQYERVQAAINPVTTAILVGIVAVYLWRLLRRARTRS
jgi:membrane protein DedA with SNARE-associated domain